MNTTDIQTAEGRRSLHAVGRRLRCDVCGKYADWRNPSTRHAMTQPDCAFGGEEWETLCADCNKSPNEKLTRDAGAQDL